MTSPSLTLACALPVLFTVSTALAQEPALQVDWIQSPINGHWCGVDYTPRTWADSEVLAVSLGGHLATIRSQAEQDWIEGTFGPYWAQPNGDGGLWIGLWQDPIDAGYSEPGGGWKWSSGEPLSFVNWHPVEPNNITGHDDFAELLPQQYAWRWNDEPEGPFGRPLVELPLEPHTGWSWPRTTTTPQRPWFGALSDFDGDGDLDYASPNGEQYTGDSIPGDSVTIYLNDGAGNFSLGWTIPVPEEPYFACAIDWDQDGDDDLAVTCRQGGGLVLLENQTGSWAVSGAVSVGASYEGLDIGDFNSDGLPDLAATEELEGAQSLRLFMGLPGGGFLAGPAYDIGGVQISNYVVVADLNGDGVSDVGLTRHSSDNLRLFFGDGAGALISGAVLGTGVDPNNPKAEDVDQDGDLDLIVPCQSSHVTELWLNDGVGGFTLDSSYSCGLNPVGLAVNDLDGDGAPDLVVTSILSDEVRVLWNDGLGSFGSSELLVGHDYAVHALSEDLDGNSTPDLLVVRHEDSGLGVWLNQRKFDCNANGVSDGVDVQSGTSFDCNSNGTPDECEIAADVGLDQNLNGVLDSCECNATNFCLAAGNSSGTQAIMSSAGSLSVSDNSFTLHVNGSKPLQFGMMFYGAQQQSVFYGEGMLCVMGPLFRLAPVVLADNSGHAVYPLDFGSAPAANGPGTINAFSTWNFQFWYRDPLGGPSGFNFSDGLQVMFCP